MNSDQYARISEAFIAASDARPEDRPALLDRLCGSDVDLRREVEALLACDGRSAALDTPALGMPVDRMVLDVLHQAAEIPHRIGQYEILGVLGQGGMGTVYRARQSRPDRAVALKVVNPALLTPAMLKRFEFEAQVLAQLQHPGIAQIFEAGTAEVQGQRVPFFAMELVEGLALTEYATQRKLDVAQRLRLMMLTCDAVHHAHQKGIIHRDLKPANILVVAEATERPATAGRLRDEGTKGKHSVLSPQSSVLSAQPKVLDFGVARATAGQQSITLQTRPGQILGTLPYMSPEQLSGDPLAIDIRSDVYALGVIAHELLTGRPPYDVRGRSLAESVRIIETAVPEPLSRHDRRLGGDVETIVGRAMHKDPSRRYASAADLAREIERYLSGEAIEARRDSSMYVLKKALARHRVAVAVACAFALVLTLATAASLTFLVREARQRSLAEKHADETRHVAEFQSRMLYGIDADAMGRSIKSLFREQIKAGLERSGIGDRSDQRGRTPEEVEAGLAAFDDATSPAQLADIARGVLDEHVLRRAADTVDQEFANQPLVRAQLHVVMGATYRKLGAYNAAEGHLRTGLELYRQYAEPNDVNVGDATTQLALLMADKHDYSAAEPLFRSALDLTRKHYGAQHRRTAAAMSNLASMLAERGDYPAAESMHREALQMLRTNGGNQDLDVAGAIANLGKLLTLKGDFAEAEAAHREALHIRRTLLGNDHLNVAISLNDLSNPLRATGRYAESEPLEREALDIFRRLLGDEHPFTITAINNLANTLSRRGHLIDAESLYREAIVIGRRLGAGQTPESSLTGLGLALHAQGNHEAAEPLLREALAIRRTRYGEHHPAVATALNNVALVLHAKRDFAAAEAFLRQALAIKRETLGSEHPDVAGVLHNLAALLRDKGDLAAAESISREAVALYRQFSDTHALAGALDGLGQILHARDQNAEAALSYREALTILLRELPAGHRYTALTKAHLGRTLVDAGNLTEADELLTAAYDELVAGMSISPTDLSLTMEGLIDLYEARHAAEPAGGFDVQAAEWRQKLAAAAASAQRP